MAKHAAIVKPKFDVVEQVLDDELSDLDIANWTKPEGGYFVSLNVRPGLAGVIGQLAADIGLALTPPGATVPYKDDPQDTNLRIAPTFAKLEDIKTAMEVLVLCVKIATIRDEINKR